MHLILLFYKIHFIDLTFFVAMCFFNMILEVFLQQKGIAATGELKSDLRNVNSASRENCSRKKKQTLMNESQMSCAASGATFDSTEITPFLQVIKPASSYHYFLNKKGLHYRAVSRTF